MKRCVFIALLAVLCYQTGAKVEETERIHLSGRSGAKVTRTELLADLKAANLENIGFERYSRTTNVIGKDGTHLTKEVVGYRKKVKCSEEKKARQEMEEKLPKHLFSGELNRKADEEVKTDSAKLGHRYCKVGIEINLPRGGRKRFFFFFFSFNIFIG